MMFVSFSYKQYNPERIEIGNSIIEKVEILSFGDLYELEKELESLYSTDCLRIINWKIL